MLNELLKKDKKSAGTIKLAASLLLLSGILTRNYMLAYISIPIFALGLYKGTIPKDAPGEKSSPVPTSELSGASVPETRSVIFDADINGLDDEGRSFQEIIADFSKERIHPGSRFEGLSDEEIVRLRMGVFETELTGLGEIKLISDGSRVRVIHDEMGHVGNVPENKTEDVLSVLDGDNRYRILWQVYGGRYKGYDPGSGTVASRDAEYTVHVELIEFI
jgi:hypothetical protein